MRRLFLISSFFVAASVVVAGSLFVDDNAADDPEPGNPLVGDPAEDGTQAHPYDAIQQAIDAAVNSDEVIILPGTYTGDGNRDIDFKGKPITVRGTDPNDPNVVAATVIDCQGTEAQPHRGFYFHTNETENSVLKGLTVTNGYADKGGGILCDGSSPKIIRCTVANNTASNTDGAHSGGGIHCSNSQAEIAECTIAGNSGGGISCYSASPSISRCFILYNSTRSGGGILSFSGSPVIDGCTIKGNEAQVGGGGINCAPRSTAIILGCTITLNRAAGGGGLACAGDTMITRCVISGNTSLGSGGAVSASYCYVNMTACTIVGNRADGRGGGIFSDEAARVTVSNSIVHGNSASGANQMGYPPYPDENGIRRYIIVGYSNIHGGKEAVEGWGFTTWQEGNIDVDPLFADPGHWDDNDTPTDKSDDTWIEGDYHLKSYAGRWEPVQEEWVADDVHSPCIDAGDPEADYSAEPAYNGGRINIGAYANTEYASRTGYCPEHPIGDLDGDCKVTFADLAMLAGSWMDCNLEPPVACE